ncbi:MULTISPECIES: bile acid:sodium symporter family protein [Gracilibacillus]|uniref:bile acid:sodium symporter family protein n=1 Tax=Gracilibacillus TaxID=74385 RepID=UPI000826168F|nr:MULTISPECIES: bile acid:sodium symporter family protein [Gracilibacillus]
MKVLGRISSFAGNTFALWVILIAIISFIFPSGFSWIISYVNILLGIIMFGMGLTLTPQDFKGIIKTPRSVLIAVIAQYTIMPLFAYLLVKVFQLTPEIAVGVILVGCCPGGTASNVITFLAKGNTALSVATTTVSTLLSPILTPTLTLLLASEWMSVSFVDMFFSIVKVVLIPIILGFVVRMLFREQVEKSVTALPLVSVIGIVAVAAGVVSVNTEAIATSGLLIFVVVMLHNILGLLVGFLLARISKLNFADQKAVAIEAGMQNSALASQLALNFFAANPIAAVPSTIFSIWHNISGPVLATFWSKLSDKAQK